MGKRHGVVIGLGVVVEVGDHHSRLDEAGVEVDMGV
jgi:hypothetical protein